MPKDYSGNKKWRDCQVAYSRAQLDYPEGLGIKISLKVKRMIIGWQPLWQVSPDNFERLITRLRKEYGKLKANQRRDTETDSG